jgi:alkylation response protein AidB-like acyl-CoA dehydrogenase
MESAISSTREYLKGRKQYNTVLATLQALQHRMADMYVELELSRSMLFRALTALCNFQGALLDDELAGAKVKICSAGLAVAADAIQLHGAMGVCEDVPVGHQFRQLAVLERLLGCTDFHLQRLGRHEACPRGVPR